MTKTFSKDSILPVEDYFVVVDKQVSLKGQYLTDGVIIYFPSESRDSLIRLPGGESHLRTKLTTIIATIGKRIRDIPLVELPQEDADDLALKSVGIYQEDVPLWRDFITSETYAQAKGFKEGYKANKGKYSEEDIRKAYQAGEKYGIEISEPSYRATYETENLDEDDYIEDLQTSDRVDKRTYSEEDIRDAIAYGLHSFEEFDEGSNYDDESRVVGLKELQDNYIQSTQIKRPISITLEYHWHKFCTESMGSGNCEELVLTVSKDNTTKALEVKYETI